MRFPGRQVAFAGATIFGLLACSASNSAESGGFYGGGGATGFAGQTCTEDAGVLTPIGPQGCGANQTVVYRKPLAGSGASAITSAARAANTAQPAMVTACTDTKCAPGQVAVVSYQASASSDPLADGGGSADAGTAFGEGAAPGVDGGVVVDGGADAAPLPDGEAPDASGLATADAAGGPVATATATAGEAGVIGIPCGAVVTCIDMPPTCPHGQSPSYTPSGKWHCMPVCDPNDSDIVVITYGSVYGNTSTCAPAPPMTACPTQGDVWTWDYANEEWVCAPECNNGQYDRHDYNGQTVCVPC